MSTTTLNFPSKSTCLVTDKTFGRYQASNPRLIHFLVISKAKDSCSLLQNQSRGSLSACGLRLRHDCKRKMDVTVCSSAEPGPPLPSDSWKAWLLGFIMTIIVPFGWNKWGPLLTLKQKVETAIDVAENVTEIVEKVADEVDKVAEEIADHLPKGKLQKVVRFVEKAAEETSKDADVAEQVFDKLEDVEKEVESFFEGDNVNDQVKKKITGDAKDEKKEEVESFFEGANVNDQVKKKITRDAKDEK
ncbi:Phage capsid scaffolding protein (GPO) serine peptidase [Quillaja saponaria]|uniref:Phage capsid scaffolding protein (GPO) serine peptidase n=1 Tax=Quillaja saponaria TaxID=32244 RepID=A0AAD7PL97_QUISA|nr:Phage capsid scaffolding protein (GPO) serine peptidase [Quillaja saponaria]